MRLKADVLIVVERERDTGNHVADIAVPACRRLVAILATSQLPKIVK